MANDDIDFIVRIKDITNPGTANAAIVVRPNVIGDGSVTVGGTTSDPLGTHIKFKLNAAMQTQYKFDTHPICVYDRAAGQTDCPGGANTPTFPANWKIPCTGTVFCNPDKNDKKFVLAIPVLNQGADYKYKLFLVDKTTNAKVVIDPRIGCCQYNYSFVKAFFDRLGDYADIGFGVVVVVAAVLGFGTARAFRK